MQIIILGMHRSGTSALTRLINMMGAYFGPPEKALPANSANPKGFWERTDVMNVNNALLQFQNCRWDNVSRWDNSRASFAPPEAMQYVSRIITEMNEHAPWVLKDPRLCVTLPCWRPLLKTPVAVITSRDPREIARSLQQRDKLSPARMLALWEYYAVGMVKNAALLPRLFVRHDEIVTDPVATTQRVHAELSKTVSGLTLPSEKEVLAFVEPSLYRAKKEEVMQELSAHQERLHAMLRGEEAWDATIEVSPPSQQLFRR